jgi:hypothetical protein
VLAFQFRATDEAAVGGGGVGGGVVVVVTPSPDRLSVPGEEMLGLNRASVAVAGPATFGVNHTWKVTLWFGASEKPGERSE